MEEIEDSTRYNTYQDFYTAYMLKSQTEIDNYTKIYNDNKMNCNCTKWNCLNCQHNEVAKNSLNFLTKCRTRRILENEQIMSDPHDLDNQKLIRDNIRKFSNYIYQNKSK
jgi:hypothetical protein